MEFFDLSRYFKIKKPAILPFRKLKKLKPIVLTHDLRLAETADNAAYAKSLAEKGLLVVPIKKQPPHAKFLNRETFPRRILFEMTSCCNFMCRMCPRNELKRPVMNMAAKDYKRVIDEIDKYGIEGLWLYHLGESLLHPEFENILKYINRKKNLGVIWLSTNGEFFTADKIKLLINSKIDYINFSAHSVTEKIYQTVISKPGAFKRVQANLQKFYELKGIKNLPRRPFLHCQMIEQETTKGEIDAFIKKHYAKADIVSVNMLEYANLPNNKVGLKLRARKKLTSCTRVSRNDCLIFSNGVVTLCDAAYNGEINLGNIHEKSLYEIWNGPVRRRILELNRKGQMYKNEFCRRCTDYDI